ncbi:ABC transporter permease, partial [Rhizobium ruizarguesonis]
MDAAANPAVTTPVKPPRKGLLSPTNIRRWQNFKANGRGYWSLWLFMVLFILSLFAEFLANDRPIIASYKGEILFPVLID